ncbi:hypothetical protein MHO82_24635 [Vibrio sp. Of7-15]|nr:hypothetical protein [Vibrio sp. Of7-15]
MTPLEHIRQLKAEFRHLSATTPKPKAANKLPSGCSDFRFSRAFQVQARRALMSKGGVA